MVPGATRPYAEAFFAVAAATSNDAIVGANLDGVITSWNPAAERLFRYHAAEALGQPTHLLVPPDRRAEEEALLRRVRGGEHVADLPTLRCDRTGAVLEVALNAAPVPDERGRTSGVVLVFRDVGEHRRAELAANRLAAIVEGSEDAIVGKDLRGIVTSWNPAAQRVFGYEPDEMIGTSITRLIPPERLNEEQEILGRLQRGERVDHFETVRIRKDGHRIDVSLTISPIRDRDGQIIGASKIARDITAQKQSEMALRAAQVKLESHALELERTVAERTAKLQEIVSELEAFSYSLSHDLRAPLRAIQGFTEIVLTDYGDRVPEAADYLRRVAAAATRMDHLIQDVLAFARVSRQEIAVGPVNLEKLVDDLVNERAELHPPQAELEIVRPLLPVVGHDASLTQCLTNLLGNAVKFVSPGTVPHVRVYTEARGAYVRVNVQDNGIGIDPAGQRRLFTVFQRLANSRTYEGTGVGLAIVRKAAERMGGRVGVESKPGAGSTFWVELPAA